MFNYKPRDNFKKRNLLNYNAGPVNIQLYLTDIKLIVIKPLDTKWVYLLDEIYNISVKIFESNTVRLQNDEITIDVTLVNLQNFISYELVIFE